MEQRRHHRVSLEQPVTFASEGGQGGQGLGRDISLGGMFVQTTEPADFGADVEIQIALGRNDAPMRLRGTVRWTRDDGMGVQFGPVGARDTFAITEFVRAKGG